MSEYGEFGNNGAGQHHDEVLLGPVQTSFLERANDELGLVPPTAAQAEEFNAKQSKLPSGMKITWKRHRQLKAEYDRGTLHLAIKTNATDSKFVIPFELTAFLVVEDVITVDEATTLNSQVVGALVGDLKDIKAVGLGKQLVYESFATAAVESIKDMDEPQADAVITNLGTYGTKLKACFSGTKEVKVSFGLELKQRKREERYAKRLEAMESRIAGQEASSGGKRPQLAEPEDGPTKRARTTKGGDAWVCTEWMCGRCAKLPSECSDRHYGPLQRLTYLNKSKKLGLSDDDLLKLSKETAPGSTQ